MNHEQTKIGQPHAPGVMNVLEGEDWNFHDRIDEVLQRAIEEYLEKRGR